MKISKLAARTFGIAFLIGYFSYGFGFGILNSFFNAPDSLHLIYTSRNEVIFEAGILMALFAPVNIVLGIIMIPIFKKYNPALAYGYLSSAIASTVLLIIGAIFLLLAIPISEEYIQSNRVDAHQLETLFLLCQKANFYCYQIAMFVWGIGGLVFSYLLLISKLVPVWMAKWGIIGYIIFIAGAVFALFGIKIDIYLDIPGGLFELFLSVWLIVKGFRSSVNEVV